MTKRQEQKRKQRERQAKDRVARRRVGRERAAEEDREHQAEQDKLLAGKGMSPPTPVTFRRDAVPKTPEGVMQRLQHNLKILQEIEADFERTHGKKGNVVASANQIIEGTGGPSKIT